MPVVNHTSRVYHTWVNGNEHFYYQGNLDALNDTLRKFAQEKAVREVVLRPGPGMTTSFDRTKKIDKTHTNNNLLAIGFSIILWVAVVGLAVQISAPLFVKPNRQTL